MLGALLSVVFFMEVKLNSIEGAAVYSVQGLLNTKLGDIRYTKVLYSFHCTDTDLGSRAW